MSEEACSRFTRLDLERQFHTVRVGRLFSGRPVPKTQQIERSLTCELLAVLRALRRSEELESGSINQADKAHRRTRAMPVVRPMQKAGQNAKALESPEGPAKQWVLRLRPCSQLAVAPKLSGPCTARRRVKTKAVLRSFRCSNRSSRGPDNKKNLHRLHTARLRIQQASHEMAHLNVSGSNCCVAHATNHMVMEIKCCHAPAQESVFEATILCTCESRRVDGMNSGSRDSLG